MAQDLLLELHRRGVRLRLVDGRLDVLAPAGALTDDLRVQLRSQRGALIDLLGRSGPARSQAELVPDPAGRYEPFPLTDIQHAYWVGRQSAVELGGVATHFYVEMEQAGLDPDRLARSLRRVIDRHDMLRGVVDRDGRQRVLPEVPPYQIAMLDLTGATPAEQEAAFAGVRAEMAHRVLPADRWPLFEIRASRLDGDRLRLHVSIDLLIADAYSMRLLFADWRRCYEQPEEEPEPLAVSFRDHVLAAAAAASGEEARRAEAYWTQRLETLPRAPALPLAVQPGQLSRTEFTRRRTRVPRDRWAEIKRRAAARGLTPSVVLATAFSDVLRLWSAQQRFTLNLSLFNRPPEHPRIGSVIGDFTSVTLLEVDAGPGGSFADRAARLQAQLMRDLEHLAYSGVRVQRELARRSGGGPAATMPIVFTSALPLGAGDETAGVAGFFGGTGFFGAFRYGISQTPQVWLDHQVAEEQGELYVNWDAVEALFPAGLLDDMFAAYQDRLLRLGRDEELWDGPAPVPLPGWQVAERERVNATAAPIPERTLSELVEEQVALRPDATAVVAADGVLTYRELARRAHRLGRRLVELGAEPGHARRGRAAARCPAGRRRARGLPVRSRVPAHRPRLAAGPPPPAAGAGPGPHGGHHAGAAGRTGLARGAAPGHRGRPGGGRGRPGAAGGRPVAGRPGVRDLHVRLDRHPEGRDGRPPAARPTPCRTSTPGSASAPTTGSSPCPR